MRLAYRWTLFIVVTIFLTAGCKSEELQLEIPEPIVVMPEQVQSITITNGNGSAFYSKLDTKSDITVLLQGLKEATPTQIDDLERSGKLYQVDMMSEGLTQTYTVNDLRETDGTETSVKIYKKIDDSHSLAWLLPSVWMPLLLGNQADMSTEPNLNISINTDSHSVIVQSNRKLKEETVKEAIANTLAVSGVESGKELGYEIHWNDKQFIVTFPNLDEGNAVYFRLDDVQTDAGETFGGQSQQSSYQVILNAKSNFQGLKWFNTDGKRVQEKALDAAVLLQPIWTNNEQRDSLLVYHQDNHQSLVNLTTGEMETIQYPKWTDPVNDFGNDYGTNVLFSDRWVDDKIFAVKGNKTLYSVNRETGKARKLYTSKKPIYGITSSIDNNRVAILVASDEWIGPLADLMVFDHKGKVMETKKEASYVGHSDGFLFVYPMTWVGQHTIGVPSRWKAGEKFLNSKLYVNIQTEFVENKSDYSLPSEALHLLKKYTLDVSESEILRALPNPTDEKERYFAVQTSSTGSWLIDVVSKKVTWLGSGTLTEWSQASEVIVWQSAEELTAHYIGLE